jgi:hypothetical protein
MKDRAIIFLLLVRSIKIFAQDGTIYLCEGDEVKIKPSPTKEFTEWIATNN